MFIVGNINQFRELRLFFGAPEIEHEDIADTFYQKPRICEETTFKIRTKNTSLEYLKSITISNCLKRNTNKIP